MDNIIEYEIVNWERYNPRSDRTNHSWFRLENTIATEPKLHGLSAGQKFIAVCLIAEVSKVRPMPTGKAKLLFSWLQDQLKVKRFDIERVIKHLVAVEIMRLPRVTAATPHATNNESNFHSVGPTYVRTNERTNVRTNAAPAVALDFEPLYEKYPRKLGKAEGLKRCAGLIHSQEDFDLLSRAIDRYRGYIRAQGTEERFILHFSTFIENRKDKPYTQPWRDWLDPSAGKTVFAGPIVPLVKPAQLPEPSQMNLDQQREIMAANGFTLPKRVDPVTEESAARMLRESGIPERDEETA